MAMIDPDRFRNTFETYSDIGRTDNDGLHRLTLTDADIRVRDQFVDDLESLGLDVRIDEVGNIFGRREGTDPNAAPVLVGSHLDSQPYGGRFDGQLGVLSALETLRAFDEQDIDHRRPIEIVNWTNEEGSRFKPALMGSGTFVGEFSVDETLARTDSDGTTVEEALESAGYRGDVECGPRESIHSYLELHVEQGPVLENHDQSVAVVDGIYGMSWLEATIEGTADHAGPSPMHSRRDALVAATDVVQGVRRLSNRYDDVVTTVGELTVEPGSINVIPSEVTFTADVRSYDDDIVAELVGHVESELEAACKREGTEYELEEIWRIKHTEFAESVRTAAREAVEETGVSYRSMVGGAGHDANYLTDVTDAGMLFVPSVDGRTHNEDEFTEWEDAVAGATVFAETVRRLSQ
ncbi:amidase (hydantoinase/carbamoylase family) (plasmid) [Natrialba magadii ATCC 43099]|uniref:Allantoate amidohydrolase n=1 Tax=Natrialba magadii (strain ATCC 43099 / DSM 3394 / CCM 3739 / CIP 104546 / IAM 13178 / JCM 8861 / NBRC 102185 / NCIMB 2190 / MS3) TaxID=547559 RepID=D3T1N0_NATMM|nr:Zn-dependent hydrolase [Natrialba magadii]ADD07489.1 amidase (hydantoinase/carbamoylase family) [Natrialba magadii ATCC 43099]ELY32207.1 allantoate amidohydrolase [Natrialba magadii ATCC 43099]